MVDLKTKILAFSYSSLQDVYTDIVYEMVVGEFYLINFILLKRKKCNILVHVKKILLFDYCKASNMNYIEKN